MNQAVIRVYFLVIVGVLAVVGALWPKIHGLRGRGAAVARFAVVAGLGLAAALCGFHAAGRVETVAVADGRAYVEEAHPGRAWQPVRTTALELESGRASPARAVPPEAHRAEPLGAVRAPDTDRPRLRLVRSLRARLERPTGEPGRPFEPVGPELLQPELAHAEATFAVVAAFGEVGRPESLYLARVESDGSVAWRIEAERLGLREGRLRRAARLGAAELLLVFTGVARERGLLARLTHETRVAAARVAIDAGEVRWISVF